jgi:hypothetical protein
MYKSSGTRLPFSVSSPVPIPQLENVPGYLEAVYFLFPDMRPGKIPALSAGQGPRRIYCRVLAKLMLAGCRLSLQEEFNVSSSSFEMCQIIPNGWPAPCKHCRRLKPCEGKETTCHDFALNQKVDRRTGQSTVSTNFEYCDG